VHYLARQDSILLTTSPLGEEEPGPEGAERGGYLPIPRREARAGEWVPSDASAELDWLQRPERPAGSESLSVRDGVSSEENGAIARCDERKGAVSKMKNVETCFFIQCSLLHQFLEYTLIILLLFLGICSENNPLKPPGDKSSDF